MSGQGDQLPNLIGDAGHEIESTPVLLVNADGEPAASLSLSKADRPKLAVLRETTSSGTPLIYRLLVDLSDTVNFPHVGTDHIEIHASYFNVSKSANATGQVRIGVITRIDGTDADVAWVQGVNYSSADANVINRDRLFTGQPISLELRENGKLLEVASGSVSLNVSQINTGTPLTTPLGSATPAVGDLVAEFRRDSGGDVISAISVQYRGITVGGL